MPAKSPATKHLGNNIHNARVSSKMTQLALAHKIGLKGDDAGAYISRVEANQQEPRLETINRIAKALGTTLDKLIAPPARTPA